MDIKLSISLLASKQTGALERCLDSLVPLLRAVPSELIVVFTGTDEKVKEIAERYTDEVISFAWCDDFSAARNAGLKKAKGEWFLFLDDDEWFEDVTEICDFFKTGEYTAYSSAYYIQRNYSDWSGVTYWDFHACRMTKRLPQTKFVNAIHEELTPLAEPSKYFQTYVHHYGYIKDRKKEKDKKISRNMPLLLREIEKDASNTRNYLQITREYYLQKDWEEAEKYCAKGYELCEKKKEYQKARWFRIYKVWILFGKAERKRAIAEVEDILEHGISKKNPACELDLLILYQLLVNLYKDEKCPNEVVKYGRKFEDVMAYMERKPELWKKQICGDLSEELVKSDDNMLAQRIYTIKAALELRDSESAEYFLDMLPWEQESEMQKYYSIFDEWQEEYGEYVLEVLNQVSDDSPYVLLQNAIHTGNFSVCEGEITCDYLRQQFIKQAFLHKLRISSILKEMDLMEWQTCAENVMEEIAFEDMQSVWEATEVIFEEYELYGFWVKKLVAQRMLFQGYLNGEALQQMVKEYAASVLGFYRGVYREDLFEEKNVGLLPKECQFAMLMLEVLEKLEKKELGNIGALLKKAIVLLPEMNSVIKELIRQMEVDLQCMTKNRNEEMEQLGAQMKVALRGMIEKGQCREAVPVVEQLLPLFPDDLELLKIRQSVLRGV